MKIATENTRHRIEHIMNESMQEVPNALSALFKDWIANKDNGAMSVEIKDKMIPILEQNKNIKAVQDILELKQYLSKKSHWIFGGDGWAYDIGYGGLDHVLASGENVNILVLDTEVYSNTGGQSSKSSRTGAVAQFAAAGKPIQKKDLGQIAMTYGYIFVAQVNSTANYTHLIKAITAAEAYNGPSFGDLLFSLYSSWY